MHVQAKVNDANNNTSSLSVIHRDSVHAAYVSSAAYVQMSSCGQKSHLYSESMTRMVNPCTQRWDAQHIRGHSGIDGIGLHAYQAMPQWFAGCSTKGCLLRRQQWLFANDECSTYQRQDP